MTPNEKMSCLFVRLFDLENTSGEVNGKVFPGLYLKACFPLDKYFGVTLGEYAYPKSIILIMNSPTTIRLLGERSMCDI